MLNRSDMAHKNGILHNWILFSFYSLQVTNCICKPQYTGDTCSKNADACEQRIQHPYLPNGGLLIAGNTACNVNKKGNSCQSFITAEGDLYYRCRCNGHTWIPNPELQYDNCLKRRTMCDSVICVFGKCVTTTSGTKVSSLTPISFKRFYLQTFSD